MTTVRELVDLLAAHPQGMRVVLHFQIGTGCGDVVPVEAVRIARDSNAGEGYRRRGASPPVVRARGFRRSAIAGTGRGNDSAT